VHQLQDAALLHQGDQLGKEAPQGREGWTVGSEDPTPRQSLVNRDRRSGLVNAVRFGFCFHLAAQRDALEHDVQQHGRAHDDGAPEEDALERMRQRGLHAQQKLLHHLQASRDAAEYLLQLRTHLHQKQRIREIRERGLGHSGGLLQEVPRWPTADPDLARREELEIPVQVNGKLRSRVIASPDVAEDDLKAAALADERIRALIDGHEVVKVIVVPRRLVNIVIKSA